MGQLLHGSARTTGAVRRAIQHRQESLAKPAKRHDLNPKTVMKWKKRSHVHDAPMGPKPCHSTVLTLAVCKSQQNGRRSGPTEVDGRHQR
jgi:hypothetical protein